MHFKPITLLLLVLISAQVFAQDLKLSGTVVDGEGEAVPFANVAVFNAVDSALTTGAVTDLDGIFSIAVPRGNYYLEISFVSYQTRTIKNISLRKSDITLGTIALNEDAQILEAVVVEGERSQMVLSLDKRVFEVGKDLSNISGSAADVLDNVPSVSVDVEGNVSLRGSTNARILIDGRPSSLTGINTADALRQLQSNMIDKVEIITNPSSRYDAEGEAGIINIILKKEKNTTGSVSVNAGHPDYYGGSFTFNFRQKKFNYFGGYGMNYRASPGSGQSFQTFLTADSSFSFLQKSERMRRSTSHNAQAGIDFTLPHGGVITASGVFRQSDGLNTTSNVYEDFDSDASSVRTVVRDEREEEPETNFEGALAYRKEYDKGKRVLTADMKWIENRETELATFTQTDLSIDSVGHQRSSNTEDERNLLFQSDYVHSFSEKGKFEAGVKSTLRVINNDFSVEQLNTLDGNWYTLPNLDNHLIYTEGIHAGYLIVGNEHEKFSWQTGVRGEFSDIDVSLEQNSSGKQRYFNVFPSAHASYEHSRGKTMQLSYSYRLSRPRFRELMPFSNYSDNRFVRIGNPNLRPEYTHSMEGSYLIHGDKGSILSSAYYRLRTGVVENIASVDESGVTLQMPVNLSKQNAYGLEFNVTFNPVEWWRFNGNANLFRAITRGDYLAQEFFSDTYSMTSRAISQFTIAEKWMLQAGMNYRAPRITTQGRDLAVYYADLGVSRELLKGNGTLTFSVRDVFNSRKYRTVFNREDLGYNSTRTFQWRARQFLLTFTFRLNMKRGNTDFGEDQSDFGDE